MKSKLKQLTALVCAAAMMAAQCLALRPVDTAYGASLNDQLAETRAKKQEIQQQLDKIKSDKAKALEQKELLDQQAAVIAQQIDLLEVQIQDTQDRITQNQAEEEKQYDLFCHQVRQEEERGTVSYWSVLFKATGFADLLSRMDFINEIVEHDQSVIDQLRTLRQQLAQDKADLEQQQAELTASKTGAGRPGGRGCRVFEEYAASEAGQQALLNQQAAREKELQEEIRKSEEASRNNQTAVGGFILAHRLPPDHRRLRPPRHTVPRRQHLSSGCGHRRLLGLRHLRHQGGHRHAGQRRLELRPGLLREDSA